MLFDNEVRQYVVNAPRNNGLLTIEVGVLCAPLPVALQVNGVRVVFSGTYSEYSPTLDKGDFYYSHLNLTDIKAK